MKKPTISALIIAKNESKMIGACLDTLQWCDEVVVIDSGSTDDTPQLVESKGAKLISFNHPSFARLREEALKHATSEWVFYVDADERVVPTLAKEIMVRIETGEADVFKVARSNVYFGRKLQYGGWGDDAVERVFLANKLEGWYGDVHESPRYNGTLAELATPLLHLTHRDTVSGLYKTVVWTAMEAEQLYKAGMPAVTFLTLVRKGVMEFLRRMVVKKGFKEGMVGYVEATIQAINRVLVYIQVWELQQKPPISDQYEKIEAEVAGLWSKESRKAESKRE